MTLLQRDREKMEEGKIQELISLVQDGLLQLEVAAERLNMTVDEFSELMKEKENNEYI